MIIKIGRFEIRTGKDVLSGQPIIQGGSLGEQYIGLPGPDTVYHRAEPVRIEPPKRNLVHSALRRLHPEVSRIVWPTPGDDPMEQSMLVIMVSNIDESYRRGYFNICPLTDYLFHVGVMHTIETREAYQVLQKIHCQNFELIHPTVVKEIPNLVSLILREAACQSN